MARRARKTGLLTEDPSPIKLVPRAKRVALAEHVRPDKSPRFRARWTEDEIEQVIQADPKSEDYVSLANRLGRTWGGVRRVRVWAGHILKDEYTDEWEPWILSEDPKIRANKHDVILIHKVLSERGYLDLPVVTQFEYARPLRQPTRGGRGDRTAAALRRERENIAKISPLGR